MPAADRTGKERVMKDGFIKAAAVTPVIRVADCRTNAQTIINMMKEAFDAGARIIVFPELCITGYTCQDLFLQQRLLDAAREELHHITEASAGMSALVFVGVPLVVGGKLYNTAAAICGGRLLGLVPKRYLPNYNEFYEARHFAPGPEEVSYVTVYEEEDPVPFGMNQIFESPNPSGLAVAAEICEDLWVPCPPSTRHALAGAAVIVNLSASDAGTGKSEYRRSLVTNQSARLNSAYIYASAGDGESTQDLVFSGHNLIAENGTILAESDRFSTGILTADLDIQRLCAERRRRTTFVPDQESQHKYIRTGFTLPLEETILNRIFAPKPFVPSGREDRAKRCEEILTIQALGLKKRMEHINCKSLVVGISGGLDSTLALLVMVKACDLIGLGHECITAVTMPGFGTTDRTYSNACRMTRTLGCTLREVSIAKAVTQHFLDIGHDMNIHDVTYENSQARERTQILMDIANQTGGIVVGTGDMSELALGWATYNGDHMSMYGVNASVPKTLVRHLVRYYADTTPDEELRGVLSDVLDTPVSPELLPPKDGQISQVTEDLVGPYELHDFFLYYILRFGTPPMKVYRLARLAFGDTYEDAVILKWLKTFYWRFFAQQFKRSCIPDGPKVGSVALSPRGDLRMPSDACVAVWREELDRLP